MSEGDRKESRLNIGETRKIDAGGDVCACGSLESDIRDVRRPGFASRPQLKTAQLQLVRFDVTCTHTWLGVRVRIGT
jgi:hypothetical protein